MAQTQKQTSSLLSPDWSNVLAGLSNQALKSKRIRKMVFDNVRSRVIDQMYPTTMVPAQVIEDQKLILNVLVDAVERALERKGISEAFTQRVIRNSIKNLIFNSDKVRAWETFRQQYNGQDPPGFLVISPGKACNLQCKGCYASSGHDKEKLDWDVFDQIIVQAKELWGSWFFTISGGEPLAYRSQGKDLLDIMEKHNDCMFQMYTNGTLIDRETAQRMAQLGNLTPAISVEGLKDSTDNRRGEGVHDRILEAMANLREAGVPFGISMTATRFNCEEILSDDVIDFYQAQGALYAWLFQYMPIGRGFTLDLLVTPKQRAWMYDRTWEIVKKKGFFIADFWNFGTVSGGCISAGKAGGYMYIDWNGKVMPCVFFPYSPVNVNDAFKQGKTLNDIWAEPFFAAIREWQQEYAQVGKPHKAGNWVKPCPLRDHHARARQIINMYEPEPEDEAAAEALADPAYYEGMVEYDRKVGELLDPLWEQRYLAREAVQDKVS
jgi:MoaA/NifB/PqqE/SkfB family radical SAM enzyme